MWIIKQKFLIGILFILSILNSAQGQYKGTSNSKESESTVDQLTLLELYSSEGCSSCPPADRQMAQMRNHRELWKTFVPVNFHVDYWDRLGWSDRFSNQAFSQRQRRYSTYWQSNNVYTPAFVLNGRNLGPQIASSFPKQKTQIKISVLKEKEQLKTSFTGLKDIKYQIYFAVLANGLRTKVQSGENAGKILEHEFVVVHYLNREFVKNETKDWAVPQINLGQKSLSYAFWISEINDPTPLQVIGGDL